MDIKIIIGAGDQRYDGWIATQGEVLNLLNEDHWSKFFGNKRADALLCEHVWEHLTLEEGKNAAKICFKYLKPGAKLRCAVPDGNFSNLEYQNTIKIGGPGPVDHPASGHKVVYNYKSFGNIFKEVGFLVDLLEYCDESHRFHYNQWNIEEGFIYRSLLNDPRNSNGDIKFVSLILDAVKPLN